MVIYAVNYIYQVFHVMGMLDIIIMILTMMIIVVIIIIVVLVQIKIMFIIIIKVIIIIMVGAPVPTSQKFVPISLRSSLAHHQFQSWRCLSW